MEQIITLALWPAIGLVAWWASTPADRQRKWSLQLSLVLGPLMLVVLVWRFISAADRARTR